MLENLTSLEKIEVAAKTLELLAESKGRQKCAHICVLGDLIDLLRKDILVMEEKLKDQKQDEPEVKLELVPDQTEGEN